VSRSASSSRLAVWWRGARPRTLAASIAPVVVGTAAAGRAEAWRFVAALVVGLGLQIGVNFANDYHDGVRGVDTAERVGPPRLVSSGMASPRSVLVAALTCILVAGVVGLALAFAIHLPFAAAGFAGRLLDLQVGLGAAGLFALRAPSFGYDFIAVTQLMLDGNAASKLRIALPDLPTGEVDRFAEVAGDWVARLDPWNR